MLRKPRLKKFAWGDYYSTSTDPKQQGGGGFGMNDINGDQKEISLLPNNNNQIQDNINTNNSGAKSINPNYAVLATSAIQGLNTSLNAQDGKRASYKDTDSAKGDDQVDAMGQGISSAVGPWWGLMTAAGTATSDTWRGSGDDSYRNTHANITDPFNMFKKDSFGGSDDQQLMRSVLTGGVTRMLSGGRQAKEVRELRAQQDRGKWAAMRQESEAKLANFPTAGYGKFGLRFQQGGKLPIPTDASEIDQLASNVAQYDGETHENGGIQLDTNRDNQSDIEIEDQEVIKDNMVLSDRLKPSNYAKDCVKQLGVNLKSSDTYASLSARLGDKKGKHEANLLSSRLGDKKASEIMISRLDQAIDELFQDQEIQNIDMNKKYIYKGKKAYGGTTGRGGGGTTPPATNASAGVNLTNEQIGQIRRMGSTPGWDSVEGQPEGTLAVRRSDAFGSYFNSASPNPNNAVSSYDMGNREQFDALPHVGARRNVGNFLREHGDVNSLKYGEIDYSRVPGYEGNGSGIVSGVHEISFDKRREPEEAKIREYNFQNTPAPQLNIPQTTEAPVAPIRTPTDWSKLGYKRQSTGGYRYGARHGEGLPAKGSRAYGGYINTAKDSDPVPLPNGDVITYGEYRSLMDKGNALDSRPEMTNMRAKQFNKEFGFQRDLKQFQPQSNYRKSFRTPYAFAKGGEFIDENYGDIANVVGFGLNQMQINKLETNFDPTLVSQPMYNYRDRTSFLKNELGKQFTTASKGINQSSMQDNLALKANMYAQTLNSLNQALDSESQRKDSIDAHYNQQVTRVSSENARLQNYTKELGLNNRNERKALTQANIDSLIRGTMGNKNQKDLRELDWDKAYLEASKSGDRGVMDRLYEDMPEDMRRRRFGNYDPTLKRKQKNKLKYNTDKVEDNRTYNFD